eukprot:7326383-Prymnesium_polylepis.1
MQVGMQNGMECRSPLSQRSLLQTHEKKTQGTTPALRRRHALLAAHTRSRATAPSLGGRSRVDVRQAPPVGAGSPNATCPERAVAFAGTPLRLSR